MQRFIPFRLFPYTLTHMTSGMVAALVVTALSGCALSTSMVDQPKIQVKQVATVSRPASPSMPIASSVPITTKKSQKTLITAKRSNKLPGVNLVQNKEVQRELAELKAQPRGIERALSGKAQDLSKMQEIFTDEGIPSDLLNVAFVESGFNHQAQSPAGAVGIWQFMKSTARYYGLKIDFKVDERKDIILSSLAAARHLRDLYNNYGDWYLALAAYNVGAGGIERAMEKGQTRDYWELVRRGFLPKETARFVPRILAAAIIMRNPEAHGFGSANSDLG